MKMKVLKVQKMHLNTLKVNKCILKPTPRCSRFFLLKIHGLPGKKSEILLSEIQYKLHLTFATFPMTKRSVKFFSPDPVHYVSIKNYP